MAPTKNTKIWGWFDEGNMYEAILGEPEEFFIPEQTWRDHHRFLILRQLISWAVERNEQSAAANALRSAARAILSDEGLPGLLNLLRDYTLAADDTDGMLNGTVDELSRLLVSGVQENMDRIVQDERLRQFLVTEVLVRYPQARKQLGL